MLQERCMDCALWGNRSDERMRRSLRVCGSSGKVTGKTDKCDQFKHCDPLIEAIRESRKENQ